MGKSWRKDKHQDREAFKKFHKKGAQPKHGGGHGPVHKVAGKIGQPGAAKRPGDGQPDPVDDGFVAEDNE